MVDGGDLRDNIGDLRLGGGLLVTGERRRGGDERRAGGERYLVGERRSIGDLHLGARRPGGDRCLGGERRLGEDLACFWACSLTRFSLSIRLSRLLSASVSLSGSQNRCGTALVFLKRSSNS